MNPQQLAHLSYHSLHNHTAMGSNNRFLDSMNDVENVIESAYQKGLKGISISDHQALSAHIKAEKYVLANKRKFRDFRVTYGDEIYLVDIDKIHNDMDHDRKPQFFHFLLTAKNANGYDLLRQLSTKAWAESFVYHGMRRLPTDINWLESVMPDYRGDIVASSACLGSELSTLILKYDRDQSPEIKNQIHKWIQRMLDMFGGDDFYFELMPSLSDEQNTVNSWLLKLSKAYGIPYIITTDAHYTDENYQKVHETFLKSENENRDVNSFYAYAHLFSPEELVNFFPANVLESGFKTSLKILDEIEPISFHKGQVIPKSPIPEFQGVNLSAYGGVSWDKYPTIQWYSNSVELADKYYIYQIFKGMKTKKQEFNHTNLDRINTELNVVKTISDFLGAPLSQYFLTTQKLIDIMWETGSLVGPGRGSVGCFYTAYLLDITKINAIEHGLPYWRFLSEERKDDMPDKRM